MSKNRNLQANDSQNFTLRGFNSIQVGLYFLLGAYGLKAILSGFVAGQLPVGMLSIEIVELLGVVLVSSVFLFSTLAIFFSSRRHARRFGFKVWNGVSKKHFSIYFLLIVAGIYLVKTVNTMGYTTFVVPTLLLYLSLVLVLFNRKKKKPLYYLSIAFGVLAALVVVIPSYWYSALLIAGAGFLLYGITVRQ